MKYLLYILIPLGAFAAYWFYFRKKPDDALSGGSKKETWKQPTSGVKVDKSRFLSNLKNDKESVGGQMYYYPQYQLEHRKGSGLTIIDAIKKGYRQAVMSAEKQGGDKDLELTEEIKNTYIDKVVKELQFGSSEETAVWEAEEVVENLINRYL